MTEDDFKKLQERVKGKALPVKVSPVKKPPGSPMKASTKDLVKAYKRLGSVWKVASEFGMCGQAVHERLVRAGVNNHINVFTKEDDERLLLKYNDHLKNGSLDDLAKEFGRTKNFLCRQARRLGLTDVHRKQTEAQNAAVSIRAKQWLKENGHPRGMLGKKHTQETLAVIGVKSKERWGSMTEDEKSDITLKQMKSKVANNGQIANTTPRGSWKASWREIGGKRKYFRSAWEANYARYLEWQKSLGLIIDWEHEPETFWFEGIKRGVRSYLPDFRVTMTTGLLEYHEVKGWMDDASKTKLKRMKKYHPHIKMDVIDSKRYNALKKQVSGIINGWE